jgi:hypothetical protein
MASKTGTKRAAKKATKRAASTGEFKRKTKKAEAAAPAEQPQEKGPTIGGRTKELLKAGELDTKGILDVLYGEFPGCKSTPACVAWYRSRMRESGELPPVVRRTPEQRKANKKKADQAWRAARQAEAKARADAAPKAEKKQKAPKTTRKVKAKA